MARTSNPTLLLVVLAGLSVGLWLAAHTGGTAAKSPGLEPEGALAAARSVDRHDSVLDAPAPTTPVRTRPRRDVRNVPLVPCAGETCLSGTFVTQDGFVPGHAQVALFTIEDGHPVFPPFATFAAGDDGTVRLCTKLDQDCDAVLFVPGCEPASQHVLATSTGAIDLDPFVLEHGAAVSGRVTAGDVPLPRAEIEARATAPGYEARVDGGTLGWRAGRYVWAASRAETGSDGTYTIRGLDPGKHDLRLCTVRQRNVAIDVQKVATKRANIPAADVDFALPAARLDLSFESSGAPLCCVEVQIEAGDRLFMRRTDEAGRLGFLIQPELAYGITAARFGFETIHTQLRGLTEGEHRPETLALEPQSELATLVVQDNRTAGLDQATFELRPRIPVVGMQVDVRENVSRDPSTHKFVIPNVPAGSWRLAMRSGLPLKPGAHLSRNCDSEKIVQVPDHGTQEIEMSASERGGLSVRVKSTNNAPVDATFQLLDDSGQALDDLTLLDRLPIPGEALKSVSVRAEEGRTYWIEEEHAYTTPFTPGEVRLYASWCAGAPTLRVTAPGMETVTQRVSIVVGELTPVNVVLHPK